MKIKEKNALAEVKFQQAQTWQLEGKVETAIAAYKEVLNLEPDCAQASLNLGSLLVETGALEDAITVYSQALEFNPNYAELHKYFIDSQIKKGGINAAFKIYQLNRIDANNLAVATDDVLCFTVVRNESLRLPYFLSYYREKGIGKFFIVDNNSTDNTQYYLLQQPDVYLWHSACSYKQTNLGSAWVEILLRNYGVDHWCLIVDADELLYYPDCETKNIRQLCQQLDRKHKKAFDAILLDMYSDKAIQDTQYIQGQNFLDICPYFDKQFYHTKCEQSGLYKNQTLYVGGMRERVFGKDGDYYLNKVPLIKYSLDRVSGGGQHFTNCSQAEIALESGCLLHFKYFSSFLDYVEGEVTRKEHYANAMQYAEYAKKLNENQALTLFDPDCSIKLKNSQQLVQLGIMNTEDIQAEV